MSAEDFGKLVGVSGQTIYKWEQRRARSRQTQLVNIAATHAMGKREARRRLEDVIGAEKA